MTPVFGEFRHAASNHIAAAVSFGSEPFYGMQCGVVMQLDRLTTIFQRYLADLPLPDTLDPARKPERNIRAPASPATVAIDRAAQLLHPAAADLVVRTYADNAHPAVAHLAAAADSLAAGRDLLHTHYQPNPDGTRADNTYWAPAVNSGPVTAALLADLSDHVQTLASWIATLPGTPPGHPAAPASAQLALRAAQPWLALAGTAIHQAQAKLPGADHDLLDAIPVSAPPPRQPSSAEATVSELCHRIPLTAERLRNAAFTSRQSLAVTSVSWRRDALASAIISHASELVLRTLTQRARQLGLEQTFQPQLSTAADSLGNASRSWRSVTSQWDILTTGAPRDSPISPVAAEIQDLVVQIGRLAYSNPRWTPAAADASPPRYPASLAESATDAVDVLGAIHQATDAIVRIGSEDHDAAVAAAQDNRIYVPVRLLSETYDIPDRYTPAPAPDLDALTAAYHNAIQATRHTTAVLDDLAATVRAPSSILAYVRRASATADAGQPRHRPLSQTHTVTARSVLGAVEQALHDLRIRDPALLLRAAVIDKAARNLLIGATASARRRGTAVKSSRRADGVR